MTLEDYIEPSAYDAAFWMAGVYDDEYPFEQLGDLALEVCSKIRSLAAMVLFSRANVDGFLHNLIRSGRVWERYLQRCVGEGHLADYHRCSGRIFPFFDALTSGNESLANSIIALSPDTWQSGREYEDDFCYGRGLQCLWSGSEAQCQQIIAQYQVYREGKSCARLALLESLFARSQNQFDAAFDELLRDRQLEIAANVERGELEEPHVIASRSVFIEGLAILKLADRLGLKTEDEYLYCPSIARVPMVKPFPGE
jgi:Immunity protein 49